jgi:hypothetical protein
MPVLYDRNKPVLKLSWQITNNIKNLGGQNNNENKMMITTDDKIRLQELSIIDYCYKYIMNLNTKDIHNTC